MSELQSMEIIPQSTSISGKQTDWGLCLHTCAKVKSSLPNKALGSDTYLVSTCAIQSLANYEICVFCF